MIYGILNSFTIWEVVETIQIIAEEKLQEMLDAWEKAKGTSEYGKYALESYVQYKKGEKWSRWVFVGYGVPALREAAIKRYKDIVYLVQENNEKTERMRYVLSDSVKNILNI
ncbi:MAG: hypothetical protein NC081_05355 [Roseburia sp.]|nr:hypothetical protein [Lachnospiraceae bacterium]MCM1568859.1 hypothetical protein [Roseburia sp.]